MYPASARHARQNLSLIRPAGDNRGPGGPSSRWADADRRPNRTGPSAPEPTMRAAVCRTGMIVALTWAGGLAARAADAQADHRYELVIDAKLDIKTSQEGQDPKTMNLQAVSKMDYTNAPKPDRVVEVRFNAM